ncbi:MAG: hypothetical protein LBH43_10195 [Treponema sp.]|nr:hypothetical protein [Treponema sp.]
MKIYKIIIVSIYLLFVTNGLFSQHNVMKYMYVNATDGLRVRNSPNINGERIALLPHLTVVAIIREDSSFVTIDNIRGKWVFIQTNFDFFRIGQGGWVLAVI